MFRNVVVTIENQISSVFNVIAAIKILQTSLQNEFEDNYTLIKVKSKFEQVE